MDIDDKEFNESVATIVAALNTAVFPRIEEALRRDPSLRSHLNPAFPFPKQLRIAILPTHLAVEYVGPEEPRNPEFDIEAQLAPDSTVLDFLGIDVSHLKCNQLPSPFSIHNLQVFVGDAIALLGDYMYDLVTNPNDIMLNGFPDFTTSQEPIYVSNTTFLWSDPSGALRIRRVDFLELFPLQDGGWPYHAEEAIGHLADYILQLHVPKYEVALHRQLNEFIELVGLSETSEPDITRYLARHPQILQLAFGAHDLNPETLLEWQYDTGKPNLKPDFMPVKMDGFADIIEFKLPRLKSAAVVGAATRTRPSAEIDSALSQIDEYNDWCAQELNRRWLEATKSIRVHSPHTYLVIGHRDDFSAEDRQKLRTRRNATIFTYDEFIAMARMQLYRAR